MALVELVFGVVCAVALSLVMAPLLDGVRRKVIARIQRRVGPPILQTFYDIAKLLSLEPLAPSGPSIVVAAPYISFAACLVAVTLLPIPLLKTLSFAGDIIVFVYLMLLASAVTVIAGFSAQSPYANIGANREVSIMLIVEPILAFILATFALKFGTLSLTSLYTALSSIDAWLKPSTILLTASLLYFAYVESGFLPFDIAEAETEIIEGVFSEYGGKLLALFKYALLIKRFAMLSLALLLTATPIASYCFTSILDTPLAEVLTLLTYIVSLSLTYTIIAWIESRSARYRLDLFMDSVKKAVLIPIIAFVLAVVGW